MPFFAFFFVERSNNYTYFINHLHSREKKCIFADSFKTMTMNRIFLFLIAVLCMFSADAFASKAATYSKKVTLQDGRETVVSLRGDENFSFWASSQGELIIREGDMWRVATEQELMAAEQNFNNAMHKTGEGIYASHPFPHMGSPKALVILVEFSDKSFFFEPDRIKNLFMGDTYDDSNGYHSYGSITQYFNDMSGGLYQPQFDFAGPYTLPGTVAHYGNNEGGKDSNVYTFVKDACAAADNDVDFSQYDADGDGMVDLVFIMYAGYGENWGASADCLWAKSGTGNYGTYDGVRVNRYGINAEIVGSEEHFDPDGNPRLGGIGVIAHEFCHTIGLPDVYPTAKWDNIPDYDNQSMEYWDLMDCGENNYNGYFPTPLTAFERELLGWIEIETLDEPANVELKPLQDGGKAYRIYNDNDEDRNEYYILEAIPNNWGTGWYTRMRGKGMLVTHINYDTALFSNFGNPNNEKGKPRWTVVPADGILMSSYRRNDSESEYYVPTAAYYADHAGDPYPGTSNVTELTEYPAYFGTVDKPITEITQDGYNISFKFMGGVDTGIEQNFNTSTDQSFNGAYNLAGQKVDDKYKGIIIKDGKKKVQNFCN